MINALNTNTLIHAKLYENMQIDGWSHVFGFLILKNLLLNTKTLI